MIGSAMEEAGMSNVLRYLARCGAYAITMLLAAVWTVGGLESLTRPLFDLGKPLIGDAIILIARTLSISVRRDRAVRPDAGRAEIHGRRVPARGVVQRRRREDPFGSSDDAMLDVALLTSALATSRPRCRACCMAANCCCR